MEDEGQGMGMRMEKMGEGGRGKYAERDIRALHLSRERIDDL